jgi:hypothetical protein
MEPRSAGLAPAQPVLGPSFRAGPPAGDWVPAHYQSGLVRVGKGVRMSGPFIRRGCSARGHTLGPSMRKVS